MKEMIPILREIQELTLVGKRQDDELSRIPFKETEIRKLMVERKNQVQERKEAIRNGQLEKRRLEKEIDALEQKKKDLIKRQIYVKTNEGYAALNKQIKRENKKLDESENNLLEMLEMEETEQASLVAIEKEIAELLEKDEEDLISFKKKKICWRELQLIHGRNSRISEKSSLAK